MQRMNDIRTSAEDTPGTLVPAVGAGDAHKQVSGHLAIGTGRRPEGRRSHNMKKRLAVVGALAATFLMAVPALAAASTITPNPITIGSSDTTTNVAVNWTGLPAATRVFITECFKPTTDPTFDPFASCSNLSELTVNPSDNAGSGTVQFPVFKGAEPTGDDSWGCFAIGETPPAGIQAFNTCYIRITDTAETNLTDQQSIPFTFDVSGGTVTPPPSVPESSLPIALPLLGVAAAGATLVAMRRRRTQAVV
jgi:hypothetical protein